MRKNVKGEKISINSVVTKIKEQSLQEYDGVDTKKTLELENGLALIKLKDWAIKTAFISALCFLALTLVCIMVLEEGLNLPSYLSYIKELYIIINPK